MKIRKKLPRPAKVAILIPIILIIGLILYDLAGSPSITPKMAFRRAENARLLGPSQILATEELSYFNYDRLIIGESEYGYTLYSYVSWKLGNDGGFSYIPKTEDPIVISPQFPSSSGIDANLSLPILIFAEQEDAVRVELDLTLQTDSGTAHISLEANRDLSGYFLCEYRNSGDFNTVSIMQRELSGHNLLSDKLTAVIRLYNGSDELIGEWETVPGTGIQT